MRVSPRTKQHCVKVSALLCPVRSRRPRAPAGTPLPPGCYSQLESSKGGGSWGVVGGIGGGFEGTEDSRMVKKEDRRERETRNKVVRR